MYITVKSKKKKKHEAIYVPKPPKQPNAEINKLIKHIRSAHLNNDIFIDETEYHVEFIIKQQCGKKEKIEGIYSELTEQTAGVKAVMVYIYWRLRFYDGLKIKFNNDIKKPIFTFYSRKNNKQIAEISEITSIKLSEYITTEEQKGDKQNEKIKSKGFEG